MLQTLDLDFDLRCIKSIAVAGGEYGPHFDRGVLSVIQQIEARGFYVPNPIVGVDLLHDKPDLAQVVFTDVERSDLLSECHNQGMSVEEGAQYARGVVFAQNQFKKYRQQIN